MSFLKFSAVLYALLWVIERFWPLLLALLIYYLIKQQVRGGKKPKDE